MLPPIRVPSVEACGTAVWSNFGFWFEPRSEPATFKIRPTHTIVPSLILINVQCSMFNFHCSLFNVRYTMYSIQSSVFGVRRSMFNFEDQTNTHNQSITHTVPYLIIVIVSPRTNSPEKYAITQFLHHSLIKIRFSPCRQH